MRSPIQATRDPGRPLFCLRPACGERATQLDQQSRLGEGDSPRVAYVASPPHPTEYAENPMMPSPRKRGEGADASAPVFLALQVHP